MQLMETTIIQNIKEIMSVLGIQETDDNKDTPQRIARMLNRELFRNRNDFNISELDNKMTTFENPQKSPQPIKVKNIKFHSVCAHHWLPFFGECDIEYIPSDKILGLSKFPRVVEYFSKRPQVQEGLTKEIGEYLVKKLKPKYLKVTMRDVTHTCVSVRGVEAECETDTLYEFREEV